MVIERAETLKNGNLGYAQTSIFLVLRNAYPNKTTIFVSQNLFTKNNSSMKPLITVESTVNASVKKVWEFWTTPKHIEQWNNASDDWHTPYAENDLRIGGKFLSRMAAKDGSFSFDFEGIYDNLKQNEAINYTMADGRKAKISFVEEENATKITENFEAEDTNTTEIQQGGWQAILDNFKKYVETKP